MAGILISTNEAAATLTLGTDAARNERKRTSSKARIVEGISVVGSAVINDAAIDMYAGDYFFGRFYVTRAGVVAAIIPDDVIPLRATVVAPGDAISLIVSDAPVTNPLMVAVYGREL